MRDDLFGAETRRMLKSFRGAASRSPVAPLVRRLRARVDLHIWEREGSRLPPPSLYKQQEIRGYAKVFGPRIFIESGTYIGDTLAAVRKSFDRLYSIELDNDLYERARARFRRHSQISILHGDSGDRLPALLSKIDEPCLFWLDGHYSEGITAKGSRDTPIRQELDAILRHHIDRHAILIDDARHFTGRGDYPSLTEIYNLIQLRRPSWIVESITDIIRVTPWRV